MTRHLPRSSLPRSSATPCNIWTGTVQKTSVHIEDGFGAVCLSTGQHSVAADGKVLSALVFYSVFFSTSDISVASFFRVT